MNQRTLLSGFLFMVCLAVICGIALQQGQLTRLRAEERQLLAQQAAVRPAPAQTTAVSPPTRLAAFPVPSELLRLRSEVTRLIERRRELAGARAENERLRAQLGSQGTNAAAGTRPPPGYVRKSEARMVGYNTPEDAIQSFLWAAQSHDLTNLLQAFTPYAADQIRNRIQQSNRTVEDYLRQTGVAPGMAILSREQQSDGSLELEVEIGPGVPHQHIWLEQVGGQWKIGQPF